MFDVNSLPPVRSVAWEQLRPGMIVAGGVAINGSVPPELSNFPVLDALSIDTLYRKYQFLRGRKVLILDGSSGSLEAARQSSIRVGEELERLKKLQSFREKFREDRSVLYSRYELPSDQLVLRSSLVEQTTLVTDRWNSFELARTARTEPAPSLFHRIEDSLTAGELLSGAITRNFGLPRAEPMLMHLVIDYSYSMAATGRDGLVLDAFRYFKSLASSVLPGLELRVYGFSKECKPLPASEISPRALPRETTRYTSFLHKLMHFRDPDRPNLVVLLGDGAADDEVEALKNAERLKKLKMDFFQLIFNVPEDYRQVLKNPGAHSALDGFAAPDGRTPEEHELRSLSDDELEKIVGFHRSTYTRFAERAGGGQAILTVNDAAGVVGMEVFDKYVSMRSISRSTP